MKILGHLILVLAVFTGLGGCKKRNDVKYGNKLGEITAKADPIKVEGRLIEFGGFPLELVSNGKLEAFQKASLSFRRSGMIEDIKVQNGNWVQVGELIAVLDNQMENLDLQQAQLRLERAKLNRLDRIMQYKVGARTPEDVSPEALKQLNSETGYEEAELSYQQALIQFGYTRLVAPVSGRVASLDSKPQNYPPGDKPFCLIINDKEFDVAFPVLEGEMSRLAKGQEVSVNPFAMDSTTYPGRITEINPLVDEHGLVKVKARIPNTNGKLLEGMNVKVFIRYKIPDCLIIPKEALVLRNNRQVVFSVLDGKSYWNYVETGLENSFGYTIKIVTGVLKVGDTIITKGNLNLAHDADIDIEFVGK